jgi:ubiquitin-conjugating enzyme E2 D/E
MSLNKRLNSEFSTLINLTRNYHQNPSSNEFCFYLEDSECKSKENFSLFLRGPIDTPYSGGLFKLTVIIPTNFPFSPPKIIFNTQIYHPNISSKGDICLNILKDAWSPAQQLSIVILSISSLLASPNPDDPLRPEVSLIFKENYDKFVAIAINETKKNAINDPYRNYLDNYK